MMNFPLLKEALQQNEKLLKGFTVPLSVERLTLDEQKEFLQTLLEEGRMVCKVKVPDKSTEEVVASFSWEGEGCYLSLGHLNLPAQRKSPKRMNGLQRLSKDFVNSLLSKESENLQYSNRSLLLYTLSLVEDKDLIVLENGTWNKKPNHPLPEKYDCIDKILALVNFMK